jgi:hypothetical protein
MEAVNLPQEHRHEIGPEPMYNLYKNLTLRRPYSEANMPTSIEEGLESILPNERSLEDLELASKNSDAKMLQLGDALMSGVHGWPRDPFRACKCYRAAAYGCSEEEVSERTGIPVGIPEACSAVAYVTHIYFAKEFLKKDPLSMNVSVDEIVALASRNARAMDMLYELVFWLVTAVTKGWVCPLALEYARVLKGARMIDSPGLEGLPCKLVQAWDYQQKEADRKELQRKGLLPRGDPSDAVLLRFATKAFDIFQRLPIVSTVPAGNEASDLHIEFREIPLSPNPIFVFAVIPATKRALKLIRLTDSLQLSPFSKDSFEYTWLRIAFELHLGDPITGERYRPSAITILDSAGDREFGAYLRETVGLSALVGTEIQVVTHADTVADLLAPRPKTLGRIMTEIEARLITSLREIVQVNQFENIRSLTQQATTSFRDRQSLTREQIIEECQRLKIEGNGLFSRGRHVAASKTYADGIHALKSIVQPTEEVYVLLGTLLSNRVACYLAMVESQSPGCGVFLMTDAISDCNVALASKWSVHLPPDMRAKLTWRRDKASAKKELLTDMIDDQDTEDLDDRVSEKVGGRGPRRRNQRGARRGQGRGSAARNRQNRQRDRLRRRRQERNRHRQSSVSENAQVDEDSSNCQDEHEYICVPGPDLLDLQMAKNTEEDGDICPVCHRRFKVELSAVYTTVLPCGHAHCIPCLAELKKVSDCAGHRLSRMHFSVLAHWWSQMQNRCVEVWKNSLYPNQSGRMLHTVYCSGIPMVLKRPKTPFGK